MLIISNIKDYYDGVAKSYGIDKTIVYNRKYDYINDRTQIPEEIQELRYVDSYITFAYFKLNDDSEFDDFSFFIVGFCGKMYMGWIFFKDSEENKFITYDLDFVQSQFNLKNKKDKSSFINGINKIKQFDPIEIHRNLNIPIFIYDCNLTYYKNKNVYKGCNHVFRINGILKDYQFYKVLDPVTTFQEIQMFISGVLGTGEKNIIDIDDKYKIPQHGFDNWSFKTRPHKKKK